MCITPPLRAVPHVLGKVGYTPKDAGMEDEILTCDVTDGVARLVMNRPAKLNALSDAMLAALTERLTAPSADPDVRVIVLAGAGKAFCAGHDLKQMQAGRAAPDGAAAYFDDLFVRCCATPKKASVPFWKNAAPIGPDPATWRPRLGMRRFYTMSCASIPLNVSQY